MKMFKSLLLLSALISISGTIKSMGLPDEVDAGSGIEELQYVTLNDTQAYNIDDVNTELGSDIHIAEDSVTSESFFQKAKRLVKKHKHAIHAVASGALSLGSVWALGQDNPMTSMIFLNGFSYNLGRLLPKTSDRQIIRYLVPAALTGALYGVDVALGSHNIDTNWAFGLIGASIAQVSWTKRLHKPKNNPPAQLETVTIE